MFTKTFELMLKSMKDCIEGTKRLYKSIPDKNDFKYSYDEIMEYEVVVKEYSKYDRETLNQIIMEHIEEDSDNLLELYEDFMDEVSDYIDELPSEEKEEEEFWNDPVMVYETIMRNQNIMDSLFDRNNDDKNSKKISRMEESVLSTEDSHVRSIDDFVEDDDLQSFDEIN